MNKIAKQKIEELYKPCVYHLDKQKICAYHKIRHSVVPDIETFDKILDIAKEYRLSAGVLANLWNTTRQSVENAKVRMFGKEDTRLKIRDITHHTYEDKFNILSKGLKLVEENSEITSIRKLSTELNFGYQFLSLSIKELSEDILIKNLLVQLEINKSKPPKEIRCYRCHTFKKIEYFGRSKNFKDGYSRSCKTCSTEAQKKYYQIRSDSNPNSEIFVKEKYCTWCRETKSYKEYDKARGTNTGLQQYCKVCQSYLVKRSKTRNYRNVRNDNI